MADLTGAAGTVRDTIGRYFSLVSVVPSALLVLWTYLLLASGAWSERPDVTRAGAAVASLGVGGTVVLVLATLIVGMLMHPVQFALVQLLEGYWGTSPLLQRARHIRMRRHRSRERWLYRRSVYYGKESQRLSEDWEAASGESKSEVEGQLIEASSWEQEVNRASQFYPSGPRAIMPTRLGNVLRSYEWTVGQIYNLDAVIIMPYLSRVAAPGDMDYVNDQRSQLDLAVRMVAVNLVATAITAVFLARHGVWMLLTLLPYGGAYLSYRGAVATAAEYGRSVSVAVTLNRFALYKRMNLALPSDTTAERAQNEALVDYLRDQGWVGHTLTYNLAESHGDAEGEKPRRGYL